MKCKRVLFTFIVLLVGTVAGAMCFYGCKSAPPDDTNAIKLPPLPPLEEVDDVCAKMADDNFKKYCYDNFDSDNDGRVSMSEAAEATDISCDNATDFTGIEYFPELMSFASISVETIDLRYNTELCSIELCYSNIRQIDLSYNQHLLFMDRSFLGCTSLTSVALPEGLLSIGDGAFSGCTSLASITLPEGLYSIDDFAFSGCVSMTSITVPASLGKIGKMAFVKCSSLNTVITNAISPPTLQSGLFSSIPRVFSGIGDSAILYTPSESVDAYKNSDWAQYFDQILAL